jgi:hypothetical protein
VRTAHHSCLNFIGAHCAPYNWHHLNFSSISEADHINHFVIDSQSLLQGE